MASSVIKKESAVDVYNASSYFGFQDNRTGTIIAINTNVNRLVLVDANGNTTYYTLTRYS